MADRETFAGRVRAAAKALAAEGKAFRAAELADRTGVQTYREKRRVRSVMSDFGRSGEIVRVEVGLYRYVGKPGERPTKQQMMWAWLKSARGNVTVEELRMMADVTEAYALEWLRMLQRRGMVENCGNGRWRVLIKLPHEMPENEEKAEKLRRIRAARQAVSDLEDARKAIERAERTLEDLERILEGDTPYNGECDVCRKCIGYENGECGTCAGPEVAAREIEGDGGEA